MALLPVLDVISGESLTSYLSRVAWFHGNVGLPEFLDMIELSQQETMCPLPAAIERVSALTGQPARVLGKMTFVRSTARKRSIGGETVDIEFANLKTRPFCPACLMEDARPNSLSAGFPIGRIEWQIQPVRVCSRHGIVLQAHKTTTYAERFQLMPELSADKATLENMMLKAEYQKPSGLQKYVMSRIEGCSGPAWLDGQQMDLAARACEMLGIVISRGSDVNLNNVTSQQWAEAGDVGYGFAVFGEAGIHEGLKIVFDRHVDQGQSGGPQKALGRLYQWLQFKNNSKQQGDIRHAVREFILDHFPIEVGSNLFKEPVLHQRVHSVCSLSRQSKIHLKSLRHAAEVTGLIQSGVGARPLHQTFDLEAGETLTRKMLESMPTNALPAHLNCNRVQAEQLVRTGVIPRIIKNPSVRSGILTNVAISDADAFLIDLLSKAKRKRKASPGMMDIVSVAQVTHVPVIDIVKGVLSDLLVQVEVVDPIRKFKGILVDPVEIRAVLSSPKTAGFVWKSEAADLIGLPVEGLSRLLKMRNPGGELYFKDHFAEADGLLPKQMLDLEEVHAFNREHISLKDYATHLGVTPRVASHRLKEMGVDLIARRKALLRNFYRRADIAM